MTNVLPFSRARTSNGKISATEVSPSAEQAEILFFTGVRYERHIEVGPQNATHDPLGSDTNQTIRGRKTPRRA
jgi:hypothetical protein